MLTFVRSQNCLFHFFHFSHFDALGFFGDVSRSLAEPIRKKIENGSNPLSSQSEKCKVIGQTCHVIELAAASSTTALAPDQAPSVHDPTANDRARQETQTPLKYKLESEGVGAKVIWNGPQYYCFVRDGNHETRKYEYSNNSQEDI